MKYSKVVAIDGPSGSGKSTIAKLVAQELGHVYIDTGAMFRALGLYLSDNGIDVEDLESIQRELHAINFEYGSNKDELVIVNGVNYTNNIRQHHVSDIASRYSKVQLIRNFLRDIQRNLVVNKFCIMEGRDIGTVIFPDAYLKISLTASDEVRAKRRQEQLATKGEIVDFERLVVDIKSRDERDSNRSAAPLIKAEDAIELLTDNLTIEQVVERIIEFVSKVNHRIE